MWDEAHAELNKKVREIKEWREERRRDIVRRFPLPNWFEFLQIEAVRGDSEALAILRLKEDQQRQAGAAFAAANDPAEARHVVFSALRPAARKNGQLVYNLRDGGQVIDGSNGVRIEVVTPQAIFLTLSINAERWPGRPVPVEGREDVKRQMVEIAAKTKLDMTFADSDLERLRCRLRGLSEPPSPAPPTPKPGAAWTAKSLLGRLGQAITGNSRKGRV